MIVESGNVFFCKENRIFEAYRKLRAQIQCQWAVTSFFNIDLLCLQLTVTRSVTIKPFFFSFFFLSEYVSFQGVLKKNNC